MKNKTMFLLTAITAVLLTIPTAVWGQTPRTAQEFFERGVEYFNKGDYDRAIADFTQAIRLSPHADAYHARGLSCFYKEDYDRAIADCNEAIKLDPRGVEAYLTRGAAYDSKGDYDRAITDYTEVIRLAPQDVRAHKNRGYAYFKKGNFTQARADVDKALQIDPNYQSAKDLSDELSKNATIPRKIELLTPTGPGSREFASGQ